MPKKKTHEEFVEDLKERYGNEYIVLGKYINNRTKIKVRHNCKKCNYHEWEITPDNLLRGKKCPKCFGNIKKTTEDFRKEIYDKYGNEYEILGEYKGANIKILVRHNCKECNYHEWNIIPINLLKIQSCPICAKNIKKTTEEFKKEVYNKYGDEYEVLGEYKNANTKILVRHNCSKCNGYKWKVLPYGLLKGKGCPVCSNRTIVLGINTIWDTDRWMVDLGVSEEDVKMYTHSSGKKIVVTCHECGRKRKTRIANIYRYESISCSCGDGKSYPEKFVMNVLEQLNVYFETEYSPKWIDNKRYDFYIKNSSCIIETHGLQHYIGSFEKMGGLTLEEEQANDKIKREIALQNDIKHYIELDCRESNLEWIKNSILNSELAELFNLSNIDWTSCAKFANKNIVKEVCNYWNNRKENEGVSDLAKEFKVARTSIRSYLKKGTKLGWCNYKGESLKR
ncbi:hypothetical protein ACRTAL_002240 [Clostridium perfringens]